MAEKLRELRDQTIDKRPKGFFDRYHHYAQTHTPWVMYEVARAILAPLMLFIYRLEGWESQRVPRKQAVILAPSHASNMDHFLVGAPLWNMRVRFMAKSQLFVWPLNLILKYGGAFPVHRGHRDTEVFATARSILARNQPMVMYPTGGRDRKGTPPQAKYGIGRVALESGALIVPVAVINSERIRNWWKIPPKIIVEFGIPIQMERIEHPTREQCQAAADEVVVRIEQLKARTRQELATSGRPIRWETCLRAGAVAGVGILLARRYVVKRSKA